MALLVGSTQPAPVMDQAPVGSAAWSFAAATRLFSVAPMEIMDVLAGYVAQLLPEARGPLVALLTGDCSRAPLKVAGGHDLQGLVTSAELARLAGTITPGEAWVGEATIGGTERRVLAVAALAPGSAGSVLVVELADATVDDETRTLLHGLLLATAATYADRATEAVPGPIPESIAAAQERTRTRVEMGQQHEATLTAILSALRARDLSDEIARGAARDVAVKALIELREGGLLDRSLSEERADAAFDRLREQLGPIGHYAAAELDLAGPDDPRFLPAELALAARATTRGIVLFALDPPGVERMRVAWQIDRDELRVTIRDDGPGELSEDALRGSRALDRVLVLGGHVTVDSVPGWGTTVLIALPLVPVEAAAPNPLSALNAREVEVLAELTRGSRNAQIAEALTISSHTVKFHVANILRKLEAGSRGEAAALAREHGLSAPAR